MLQKLGISKDQYIYVYVCVCIYTDTHTHTMKKILCPLHIPPPLVSASVTQDFPLSASVSPSEEQDHSTFFLHDDALTSQGLTGTAGVLCVLVPFWGYRPDETHTPHKKPFLAP